MPYPYYQPYQPAYYQPPMADQLTQLRQQPFQAMPQQQAPQQPPSIVWVQNEMEAANYLVAPNSAVTLWDSNAPVVYLKQADASGKPSMKTYDLVERTQRPVQAQLAQCCCDNEKGQMQITNSMDSGFCQTNYNLATNTNAIIQNAHSDTDRVIAKLDAMEMSRKDETIAALRSQVDALNLAQSQANQNNYLVNTLRPCPTPAYLTCNPWGGVAYGSCASGCCA